MLACVGPFAIYCVLLFITSAVYWCPVYSIADLKTKVWRSQAYEAWPTRPKNQCFKRTPNATTTGAKLIVPALPKTGTTSMQLALQEYGYRSYKMEDYAFYMAVLFLGLARKQQDESMPSVVAGLHGCKVDAIFSDSLDTIMPFDLLYRASPGAKVIWCSRPWTAVDKSIPLFIQDLVARNIAGCLFMGGWRVLPWLTLVRALGFGMEAEKAEGGPEIVSRHPNSFWHMFWFLTQGANQLHVLFDPAIEMMTTIQESQATVDAHFEMIKALVPPEDLLVFDVKKHGWKELADFLGKDSVPDMAFPMARNLAEAGDVVTGTNTRLRNLIFLFSFFIHYMNFIIIRGVWREMSAACARRNSSEKAKDQ